MKAVEIVKNEKIDFLLAAGSGSVIDATKYIAASVVVMIDNRESRTLGRTFKIET